MQLSASNQNKLFAKPNTLLLICGLLSAVVSALLLLFLFSDQQKTVLIIFGGGIALLIGTMILLRPHWGGYALAASIMLNISDLLTESGYPGIISGLVGLTALAIGLRWLRQFRTAPPFILTSTECWIIAYIAVCFASIYAAKRPYAAYISSTEVLKDCAVLITIVFALNSAEKWKRACWIVLVAAAVPAMLGVVSLGLGIGLPPGIELLASGIDQQVDGVWRFRLGGPIRRPNFYALLMIMSLPLVLYRWVHNHHFIGKHILGLAALFMMGAIAFSYSRAAFLVLVFVLVLFALQQRVRPLHLITGMVTTTLVLLIVSPSGYTERLLTLMPFIPSNDATVDPLSDLSFAGRFSEMYSGMLMFADHPLLGVGHNNYPVRYQEYAEIIGLEFRDDERDAHSLYVELAAETGLAGLITFSGIVVTLFYGLYELRQQPDADLVWLNGITLALIAFLTNSIFLHAAYLRFFWLFVALALVPMHLLAAKKHRAATA